VTVLTYFKQLNICVGSKDKALLLMFVSEINFATRYHCQTAYLAAVVKYELIFGMFGKITL